MGGPIEADGFSVTRVLDAACQSLYVNKSRTSIENTVPKSGIYPSRLLNQRARRTRTQP
jgi:hypothetical protein